MACVRCILSLGRVKMIYPPTLPEVILQLPQRFRNAMATKADLAQLVERLIRNQ